MELYLCLSVAESFPSVSVPSSSLLSRSCCAIVDILCRNDLIASIFLSGLESRPENMGGAVACQWEELEVF